MVQSNVLRDRFVLLVVFLILVIFNLKDISSFFKENVITGYDGYYYARLSEEIPYQENIDKLRNVPDFLERESIPNLLSFLGFTLSFIFPKEYIYAFLPPLLSVLFIFPLFLWIKRFSNIFLFIPSALIGGLSSVYFVRTYTGKFDTDCLILFFVFLIILFITLSLENMRERGKAILYSSLTGISYITFYWLYPKPVFSLIFLFSFFIGFFLFYFHSLKNRYLLINFILSLSIFSLFVIKDFPSGINFFKSIYNSYFLKLPSKSSFLPISIESFTSELQPVDLKTMIEITTANPVIFVLSLIGLFLATVRYLKYMFLTFPFILLGFSSFFSGERFVIYTAPFLGLGFGVFIYAVVVFLKRYTTLNKNLIRNGALGFALFFSVPPNTFFIKVKPVLQDEVYRDFNSLREILKKNSYIWSWWDYGYAIEYLTRKGTYIDNGNKNVIKAYSIARSLLTNSEKEAYKFVSFITNNKYNTYSELSFEKFLKKVRKYTEKPKNDVYVLLNEKTLYYKDIYYLGMLGSNIKSFSLPAFKYLGKCKEDDKWYNCQIISIKKEHLSYKVKIKKAKSDIYRFVIKSEGKKIAFLWNKKGSTTAEVIIKGGNAYIVLINKQFEKSILNRMFILRDRFRNFSIVYDNFPYTVVYRVKR